MSLAYWGGSGDMGMRRWNSVKMAEVEEMNFAGEGGDGEEKKESKQMWRGGKSKVG